MSHGTTRTISAEGVARVEGEGSLRVVVSDGRVSDVSLDIFEPPRFFEAMLVGRHFSEAPDITARICGICPVAYQMSACLAMEDAAASKSATRWRRCAGCCTAASGSRATRCTSISCTRPTSSAARTPSSWPSAIRRHRARAGPEVAPATSSWRPSAGAPCTRSTFASGGFYRAPEPAAIEGLAEPLRRARDAALATVRWVAGFDFPEVTGSYRFVALRQAGRYAIDGGRPGTSDGLDLSPSRFAELAVEEQVERSTALHARLEARRTSPARSRATR